MKSVYVGSDHAGYGLKEFMKPYIAGLGYEVVDSGCFSEESCDYPNFAHNVCKNVQNNTEWSGNLDLWHRHWNVDGGQPVQGD